MEERRHDATNSCFALNAYVDVKRIFSCSFHQDDNYSIKKITILFHKQEMILVPL